MSLGFLNKTKKKMMDIESIKQERLGWLEWKNIKPLRQKLEQLQTIPCNITLGDTIQVGSDCKVNTREIFDLARDLRPWRKGPFEIFGLFIDTEWKSYLKYNLLEKYTNLEGKIVGDIGCNNGYYLFRMLEHNPKKLVGFDPSALYKTQFDFINHFAKTDIVYEMLGVEHLEWYKHSFDTLFCLGVLYHRSDPIATLKSLKNGLNTGGELFLDTFMIDGEDEYALCPKKRYSKIPNVYFIPTIAALQNWTERAGFRDFELLEIVPTTTDEQRKTEWIYGESLGDFLDKEDPSKTVEGYPAPKRAYIKARR